MDDKLKILLCEDDENLGMLLREYLAAKGYVAELCPDGEAGYKAFLKTKFDICVLDVMMPKKDGFTLAQEIRQANPDIPIIVLTAKDTEEDMLEGFQLGADDYIAKPFSIKEVLARVKAVLGRTSSAETPPETLSYEGLCIHLHRKVVTVDGEEVSVTRTEFELLVLLLQEQGHVFSRQQLIERVWPKDVIVTDRTVDVNITRLRKKIGHYANHIVTRQGYGYCFEP